MDNFNIISLSLYSLFFLCLSFTINWDKGVNSFLFRAILSPNDFNTFQTAMKMYTKIGVYIILIYHVVYFINTDWWATFILFIYGNLFSAIIKAALDNFKFSPNFWARLVLFGYICSIIMFFYLP